MRQKVKQICDDPNTTTYTWDKGRKRYVKKFPNPEIRMQIGLDVGQLVDFTALIVNTYNITDRTHNIERIERWKSIPYPELLDIVQEIVVKIKEKNKAVQFLIDSIGPGLPLLQRFWRRGIAFVGVSATSGDSMSEAKLEGGKILHIPKEWLVGNFNLLLNGDMIGWGNAPKNRDLLTSEVHKFRQKISKSANLQFNAEVGTHDDLLDACMLATWEGEQKPRAGALW